MSAALLSMYDFVEFRNSNPTSNQSSVTVTSSTGDKQKPQVDHQRLSGLYHQQSQPQQHNIHSQHQAVTGASVTTVNHTTSTHKMSGGIRRTVSSATTPSSGMGSVNSPARPVSVVKSLSSNTQASVARAPTNAHHISSSKDPHKKLDRSFSEPAEKKNSASAAAAAQTQPLGPSSRYKTELCRSFAEVGSCKYSDKCQFAHGEEELRTVTRHPKFKTENCKSFHTTGFCPYGPRCHFIHNDEGGKKCNMQSNGSNNSNNGPSTPTINQRMFDGPMSAPVAVIGSGNSQFSANHQPSPFTTSSPAVINNNHNANLVRPKALSLGSYSLGSSGEISPPSSQSGSPTSLNSFFGEDGFGLSGPFGTTNSNGNNSRMAAMNAFQSGANSTFSFSPDSAFVSFSSSGASSNGSTSGSSLSFGGSQKCVFGGSQPTLNSHRFSPEPTSADETANSVIFSLFGGSPNSTPFSESSQLNDFIQRTMSPIGKPSHLMMAYPSSPESPVDSVASEIEALKLGEVPTIPSTFSPISSSFSTSSLSNASVSPPNGIADVLDAFTLQSLSSAASAVGASQVTSVVNNNNHCASIPRLPTFTRFATNE